MFLWARVHLVMIVCACAFFLVALLGLGPTPTGGAEVDTLIDTLPVLELPDRSELVLGVVVRVIDGDTILVKIGEKTRRYQLLGADAPELSPRDRAPDPHSINARRFIEQLLLDETVYIQHDPSVDRDGLNRVWGYLFRAPDMLLVNLELVRQGYARHDPRHGALYSKSFAFYGARAERLGKGIWDPQGEPLVWSTPSDEPAKISGEPFDQSLDKPEGKPGANPGVSPSSLVVYITKFGSKYHAKDCPHLTDTQSPATREEVKETHAPCKTCKPDDASGGDT